MAHGTGPCVPDRDFGEDNRVLDFYARHGDPPQSASLSRESNDDALVFL